MAEFSDEQYNCLIGLLAENRSAVRELAEQLTEAEARWNKSLSDINLGLRMQGSSLSAIEQDLSRVQGGIRSVAETLLQHDQALDGLTQLGKTNFDLLESLQQRVHGESSSIGHDRALTSEPTQ